ncbi:MAG: type II toxin-antitoxin system prevent-host-death family antitoxin [Anaerolineae bacterium]|nr:type II toxin-antitoxin system prevent-host-death family antitoxin [Anaerolineae bacterium]
MRVVGVRELKQRASELVRLVREEGEEIDVTLRGEVVARLVPVKPKLSSERIEELMAEMDKTASEISAYWPQDISAVAAVREERREL